MTVIMVSLHWTSDMRIFRMNFTYQLVHKPTSEICYTFEKHVSDVLFKVVFCIKLNY